MTKENEARAKTKKVVIQLEDWIDNIEAWEENIYAFMVYGKDLLKFMVEQHPETKKAFMDARVQRIYGGTSEIMKEIISRNL